MKTFYCVTSALPKVAENPNLLLLQKACEAQGVAFVQLIAPESGLSFEDVPVLGEGGIYMLNTPEYCFQYTYALIKKNPHLKTVYEPVISLHTTWRELISDESAGVPTIPAIYEPTEVVDDVLLEKIQTKLGGFPVILKRSGGSHGTGIMLIDSAISLKTTLPHLIQGQSRDFALKKFIVGAQNYRVIVLGGKVISSIIYLPIQGDIRTNATKLPVTQRAEISDEWKAIAVRAAEQKGVTFGGIDLLVDESGQPFVAEMNTPCNFSRCENLTGDPIAARLVQFLC
jgi:hypothetical protein